MFNWLFQSKTKSDNAYSSSISQRTPTINKKRSVLLQENALHSEENTRNYSEMDNDATQQDAIYNEAKARILKTENIRNNSKN